MSSVRKYILSFLIQFLKIKSVTVHVNYKKKNHDHVIFLDPPVVTPLPNIKHVEGEHVQITCNVIAGNPPSTTIYWTKSRESEFKKSGSTLVFSNVSRTQSGRYSCVAENNYLNGGKGTDQESFVLDVMCRLLFFLHDFKSIHYL